MIIPACFEALQVHVRCQARAHTPREAAGWGAPCQEDDQGQEGDLRVHRQGRPGQDAVLSGWCWFNLLQDELGLLEDEFDDLKDNFKVLKVGFLI